MSEKYCDIKTVCDALSLYHIDDIVISLKTLCSDKSDLKPGTKFKITDITLRNGIIIPEITEDELKDYASDCDEYNFIYTLKPIDARTDETFTFSSSEFEMADTPFTEKQMEIIRNAKKRRKASAAFDMYLHRFFAFIPFYLAMAIFASIFGSLFLTAIGTKVTLTSTVASAAYLYIFWRLVLLLPLLASIDNKNAENFQNFPDPFRFFYRNASRHCITKKQSISDNTKR